MTTQEVIKKTGLCATSVGRLIHNGTFKAVKHGSGRGVYGRYDIDEESVNEFLKTRGIKEGYFRCRSQSLDDPIVMFPDDLKKFIESIMPDKFMSRGEITRTIISMTDIGWSAGTISNDLMYYKARKSRLDTYIEFFSKYGYSPSEDDASDVSVVEVEKVPVAPAIIVETKPFDVKTLTQADLFKMLSDFSPSQTLYLTMLMTNDLFYRQEVKKYEKN